MTSIIVALLNIAIVISMLAWSVDLILPLCKGLQQKALCYVALLTGVVIYSLAFVYRNSVMLSPLLLAGMAATFSFRYILGMSWNKRHWQGKFWAIAGLIFAFLILALALAEKQSRVHLPHMGSTLSGGQRQRVVLSHRPETIASAQRVIDLSKLREPAIARAVSGMSTTAPAT